MMSPLKFATVAFSISMTAVSSVAIAGPEFRLADGNNAVCAAGERTGFSTNRGPNDVLVARSDNDDLSVAVCNSGDSDSGITMRYKTAAGEFEGSAVIRDICGIVTGVAEVHYKNTETGPEDWANVYTCVAKH